MAVLIMWPDDRSFIFCIIKTTPQYALELQIKWLGIYIYLFCIVGGGIMNFFLLEISKKVKTACFTAFNLWAGPFSIYFQDLLTFCFVGADSVVTTWEQAWRSANLNHLWIVAVKAARSDAASGIRVSGYPALSRIKSEGSGDREIHPDREVEAGSTVRVWIFHFRFSSHLSDSDTFPLSMTLFSWWRSSGGPFQCIM